MYLLFMLRPHSTDAEDIKQEMSNCKAVLVDTSARKELVEAFIEHYVPLHAPLVLNPMHAGTDDNKKCLAQRVLEKCDPSAVSGRMGDIYALAEGLMEQGQCRVPGAEVGRTRTSDLSA